jgi:hypothetical protein
MPLHDWTNRAGWEGVDHLWITELLRWIKPRLPAGYRTFIGSAPTLAVGAPDKPAVAVHDWPEDEGKDAAGTPAEASEDEPDTEVAVAMLHTDAAVFVERAGELVAAVELVSPRNKDRLLARTVYLTRYLGYLLKGVHLLLVDVHRRPLKFSFADRIAEELQLEQPPCPAPFAVSYRVGEEAPNGGRFLAVWRRPLAAGQPLPSLPLPLTIERRVSIDLEKTYLEAAASAYLT